MAIEKLGDYLQGNQNKDSLQRIYWAYCIEKEIAKIWSEKVKVVLGERTLTIICTNPAQATALSAARRRLYVIASRIVSAQQELKIRFKVDY